MNKEEINKIIEKDLESNDGRGIAELMMTLDIWGSPFKIAAKGICVPVKYSLAWVMTYGCNNWRKLHGIPMMRGLPMKRKQSKFNNR